MADFLKNPLTFYFLSGLFEKSAELFEKSADFLNLLAEIGFGAADPSAKKRGIQPTRMVGFLIKDDLSYVVMAVLA